ncbi:MAG: hypothetical protein E6J65_26840, partial [Deltaproteobacteria bacterium]
MRIGRVVSVVSSVAILTATAAVADEFRNPHVIRVAAPGGDIAIRARRGTASVPGLGDVGQIYGYEVF